MSQNSSDLRVRRTHKLLREALLALIEERSFDALTVGEIANRAMVSRAAFYRYYQDKYALVEQIFEDSIGTLVHDLDLLRQEVLEDWDAAQTADPWGALFASDKGEATPEPLVRVFEHFAEYERLYRVLLGGKGSAWFRTKMRSFLAEMISERLQMLTLNGKRLVERRLFAEGLVPTLLAGLGMEVLTWWLEHGRAHTPRQAAAYCFRLVVSLLKEVHTWE